MIGKPSPYIFKIARQQLDGCAQVAVVGDHLDSDISGAKRAGLDAILVISGITSDRDLAQATVIPDLVVADLAAFAAHQARNLKQAARTIVGSASPA